MTTHTADSYKTNGKYGLYRRTAPDDKGQGAGVEVLLEEDEVKVVDCKCVEGGYVCDAHVLVKRLQEKKGGE